MNQKCRRQVLPVAQGAAPAEPAPSSGPHKLLAETDAQMLKTLCVKDYFRYIFMTITGKGAGDRVKPPAADR